MSTPIIRHVQDSISGLYVCSIFNKKIDYNHMANLVMCYKDRDEILKKLEKREYDKFELLNMIIPKGINKFEKPVTKGEITNTIHSIWTKYDPEQTKQYINDSQNMAMYWLLNYGFTAGLKDCYINNELFKDIKLIIQKKKKEVEHLISEIENEPLLSNNEDIEKNIQSDLSSFITTISDKISKSLTTDNTLFAMIKSKAKGSDINMSQIAGCVGQNVVSFERIQKKVAGRSLAHFYRDDDRATSRGFIENSYLEGLEPHEFFFHTMAGRQGLIDTTVKTADTGYISRKFVKVIEDIMVKYDGTIRSANDIIVQLLYGDNNCDQVKQVNHPLYLSKYNNQELKDKYFMTDKKFNDEIMECRDILRDIQQKTMYNYILMDDSFLLPLNFRQMIKKSNNSKSNLTEKYVIDRLHKLLDKDITKLMCFFTTKNDIKNKDEQQYKTLLKIAIYEFLAPKRCIEEYKYSKEEFDELIDEIINKYNRSSVEPGEMVGVVTAQSLGEPSTQMSLIGSTKMFIMKYNKKEKKIELIRDNIGKIIDNIIENNKELTKSTGHTDSVETDISNLNNKYYIISVNKNEQVQWNYISHVSRHPCNGRLIKITTNSGRTVVGTLSHSFLKRSDYGIIPVQGSQLKLDDYIPIMKNVPLLDIITNVEINNVKYKLDGDIGYFIGIIIKYNELDKITIPENHINRFCEVMKKFNRPVVIKDNKIDLSDISILKDMKIPDYIFFSNYETIKEFLKVLIDNQEVVYNNVLVQELSLLLNYFGINTIISNNKLNLDDYNWDVYRIKVLDETNVTIRKCKEIIPNSGYIIELLLQKLKIQNVNKLKTNNNKMEIINILNMIKKQITNSNSKLQGDVNELYNIMLQAGFSEVQWDKIVKLELFDDNKEYVYDFTVPGNQTFSCMNGILVHNTLNTFHSTGSASIGMQGVPRIRELISCTKNIKTAMMIVYLNDSINKDRTKTEQLASYLKHTTFKEIVSKTEIVYSNDKFEKIKNQLSLDGKNVDETTLPWIIKIILDKNQLLLNDINLLYIKSKFVTYWNYIINNLKGLKEAEKSVITNVIQMIVLSNFDNDLTPEIHIRFDLSDYKFEKILRLHDMILNQFVLMGIPNIKKVNIKEEQLIKFDEKTGDIKRENQYIIFTDGVNLMNIRYYKYIDLLKTITNDIVDIYNIFGIEGARTALIKELYNVYKSSGNLVNYNHIELVVDVMTNQAMLTSIDRNGASRVESGPLSRASFEKTMEILVEASVFGSIDNLKSVSSRIICGAPIKGGTGYCDLLIDNEMLEKSEITHNKNREYVIELKENEVLNQDIVEDDIYMP